MIDCPFEEVLDIIGEYTAAVYSQRFFFIPVVIASDRTSYQASLISDIT